MVNSCAHEHLCFNCGNPHTCYYPECASLTGYQRLCARCSFLYGWAQSKDQHDESSLVGGD